MLSPVWRSVLALGLGTWIAAQSGCFAKQCTDIGCASGFQVTFLIAGGEWAAGTYSVMVTADGATAACDVTLPFASCQSSSTTCQGTRDWRFIESGCALAANQHAIAGIVFNQTNPSTVSVAIRRNGQQLAAETFTPDYQTSQPNGPDCAPTCIWAAASLPVQP